MASLVLRNATKCNAATLWRSALVPMRGLACSSNGVIAQHRTLLAPVANKLSFSPLITRNFSVSTPKLSASGGNHTTLWTIERAVSLALLAAIPAAFIFPSKPLDALMAISVVLHTHWGVEAMITDYVRPSVVGNILPKVAHGSLIIISLAALAGLLYFTYHDVGLANAVKQLWAIKGHKSEGKA